MRCRTCDYPLWSLTTRQCPECGEAFRPGDYDFVRGSVQFRCPHCATPYYGTGPRGHLVPAEFECPTCSRRVTEDEMVLLPAPGYTEAQTRPDRIPWLERHRGDWVRHFRETTLLTMRAPSSIARGLSDDRPWWESWWYALLINIVVAIGVVLPVTVLTMTFAIGFGGVRAPSTLLAQTGAGFGVLAVVTVVITMLFLVIWGPVTHALLRVGGGRPEHGLRRTYDALCYSSGTYLSSLVPCLGWNLGWIWWIVAAVIMVKDGQRVGGTRASIAVLALPVLATLLFVGAYVGWFAYAMTQIGAAATRAATPATETRFIVDAVLAHARLDAGRGPAHGLALLVDGRLEPSGFRSRYGVTTLVDVPVADATLADVAAGLAPWSTLDEEIARQPADAIAHRVGDFVFTHHGADLADPDPGLWVVLLALDPDANAPPVSIWIGHGNGTVTAAGAVEFPALLEAQNRLRALSGLPPLPDPRAVRHGAPAVRGVPARPADDE